MSRNYALALIFAAVTLVSGLFYGQYRYLTGRQGEAVAYAAGVHERVITGQLEQMGRLARRANDRMEDEAKYRFRPILSFVDNVFERRDAYLKKAENDKSKASSDLIAFSRFHDAELDSLSSAYDIFLREFGENMDLSLEDITTKSARIEEMIKEVRSTQNAANHLTSGDVLTQSLLAVDYLEKVAVVVQDVVDLSGGKTISCFFGPEFFPIVSTGFLNPRRGETVSTKLSVGNYATVLDPEDVTIIIDGDSLRPGMTGYIDYDFVAKQRGRQILEMELIVRNRLTGEAKSQGTTDYHYFVR